MYTLHTGNFFKEEITKTEMENKKYRFYSSSSYMLKYFKSINILDI